MSFGRKESAIEKKYRARGVETHRTTSREKTENGNGSNRKGTRRRGERSATPARGNAENRYTPRSFNGTASHQTKPNADRQQNRKNHGILENNEPTRK